MLAARLPVNLETQTRIHLHHHGPTVQLKNLKEYWRLGRQHMIYIYKKTQIGHTPKLTSNLPLHSSHYKKK